MASTITVTLINSQSDEPVSELTLPEGMTIQQLLDANHVNTANTSVTYRVGGENVAYSMDDELENGARVTITPENVKGA